MAAATDERLSALRDVRRSVAAGGDEAAEPALALARWREELDAAGERGLGRDWLSYRAGGVDALEDALRQARQG